MQTELLAKAKALHDQCTIEMRADEPNAYRDACFEMAHLLYMFMAIIEKAV